MPPSPRSRSRASKLCTVERADSSRPAVSLTPSHSIRLMAAAITNFLPASLRLDNFARVTNRTSASTPGGKASPFGTMLWLITNQISGARHPYNHAPFPLNSSSGSYLVSLSLAILSITRIILSILASYSAFMSAFMSAIAAS